MDKHVLSTSQYLCRTKRQYFRISRPVTAAHLGGTPYRAHLRVPVPGGARRDLPVDAVVFAAGPVAADGAEVFGVGERVVGRQLGHTRVAEEARRHHRVRLGGHAAGERQCVRTRHLTADSLGASTEHNSLGASTALFGRPDTHSAPSQSTTHSAPAQSTARPVRLAEPSARHAATQTPDDTAAARPDAPHVLPTGCRPADGAGSWRAAAGGGRTSPPAPPIDTPAPGPARGWYLSVPPPIQQQQR